jgi:hypothetical protein
LPAIDYRRDNSDPVEQAIFHECAMNAEDILRRRIGARLYTRDAGKSMESEVNNKVKNLIKENYL